MRSWKTLAPLSQVARRVSLRFITEKSNSDGTLNPKDRDAFMARQGFDPKGVRKLLKGIQGAPDTVKVTEVYRKASPDPHRPSTGPRHSRDGTRKGEKVKPKKPFVPSTLVKDISSHYLSTLSETSRSGLDELAGKNPSVGVVVDKAVSSVCGLLLHSKCSLTEASLREKFVDHPSPLFSSLVTFTLLRFLLPRQQSGEATPFNAKVYRTMVGEGLGNRVKCVGDDPIEVFLGAISISEITAIYCRFQAEWEKPEEEAVLEYIRCFEVTLRQLKGPVRSAPKKELWSRLSCRAVNHFTHLLHSTVSTEREEKTASVLGEASLTYLCLLLRATTVQYNGSGGKPLSSTSLLSLKQLAEKLDQLHDTVTRVPKRSSDTLMPHRTCYTALNKELYAYSNRRKGGDTAVGAVGGAVSLCAIWRGDRTRTLAYLNMMQEVVSGLREGGVESRFLSEEKISLCTTTAPLVAILMRVLLRLETSVSFSASLMLKESYRTPSDLNRVVSKEDTTQPVPLTPDEKEWREVAVRCVAFRSVCSQLIMELFSAFASLELQGAVHRREGKAARKMPSDILLSMLSSALFPLLRRHYLLCFTQQRGGYLPLEDTKALFHSFLSIFVLRREAYGTQGTGDTKEPNSILVCGTTLSHALEIAFFLTYYEEHYKENVHDEVLLTREKIENYILEVFLALDRYTAKQLHHLRSNDTLFYFSGLKRDGTVAFEKEKNFTLYQRFVQSNLSVVHSHVMHPSVLWMPLWQVQELFYVMQHHRGLFIHDDGSVQEGGEERRSSKVSDLDAAAGKQFQENTKRVHGYLVMRLYVISNVLRAYGHLLLQVAPKSGKHSAAVEKLLALEPAAAQKKRGKRVWAQCMAVGLQKDYPSLAAYTEGIKSPVKGFTAALARSEQTVRTALTGGFLFDIHKEYQKKSAMLKREVGESVLDNVEPSLPSVESPATPPIGSFSREKGIRITVERKSADTSFGFVIDKDRLVLKEVKGLSPFAIGLAGVGYSAADGVLGWRIVRVNSKEIHNAEDLMLEIKDALVCEMELAQPST